MNILVVTQYFWPENFRINDVVEGLVDRGHHLIVLTGKPNYPDGRLFQGYGPLHPLRESYAGARVLRVPLIPRGTGNGIRLALNYLSFAFCASVVGPMMVSEKVDAVLVFEPSPMTVGLPAMVLKAFKRIPVLFWIQDLWPQSLSATGAIQSTAILKSVELMVRFLYKGSDRILVQSRGFIQAVLALGGAFHKIRYFPNSAESLYRPVTVPLKATERILMPKGFRLTFAGNIGSAQDFDTIVKAAAMLKGQSDIHFVIIGEGRMLPQVQQSIDRLGLEKTVHLLGRFPAERMPYFFALSDALLVTLRKDPIFAMTIPSKVQSYLACGKPIIAALDGEGARTVRQAGAGLTCEAQSPVRLAETVVAMYQLSRAEREAMGKKALDLFKKEFERKSLLDKLERWLTDVIG